MDGWFKLYRNITENSVFGNPDLLKVWIWCLAKATHKEHTQMVGFQVEVVPVGGFIFGRKAAANELKMDEYKVYRLINNLKKLEKIDTKPHNKYTVVTVLNWEVYQCGEQQTAQQMHNKCTTNAHKQELKNIRTKDKDKTLCPFRDVFDHYISLDLKKHRAYTDEMRDTIRRATEILKCDTAHLMLLLDRHKRVVELTKSDSYPVEARGLTEFFGQRAYQAKHLICSEYDEGGAKYERHLKDVALEPPKKPEPETGMDPEKLRAIREGL